MSCHRLKTVIPVATAAIILFVPIALAKSGSSLATAATRPANTALPAISGTAQQGQMLSGTTGTWSGTQPISYTYQWRRCDTAGANCSSISGATSPSYSPAPTDVGASLRVQVTASNGEGSVSAQSNQTAVVKASAAGIFGTTIAGPLTDWATADLKEVSRYTAPQAVPVSKLTGYVSGLGKSSGSQPVRAVIYADSGGNPGALLGVSNQVTIQAGRAWGWVDFTFPSAVTVGAGTVWMGYIAGSKDELIQLRYDSSSQELHYNFNSGGYAAGPSNPFGKVLLSKMHYSLYATYQASQTKPVNTVLPTVSGTAEHGQTLTAATGTWTGTQPISHTYQWRRCDTAGANCGSISGATSSSYLLDSGDVGATLRAQVTASNGAGSASAQSSQTAVAKAKPARPANTALPTVSGTAQQGQTADRNGRNLDRHPADLLHLPVAPLRHRGRQLRRHLRGRPRPAISSAPATSVRPCASR